MRTYFPNLLKGQIYAINQSFIVKILHELDSEAHDESLCVLRYKFGGSSVSFHGDSSSVRAYISSFRFIVVCKVTIELLSFHFPSYAFSSILMKFNFCR